MKAFLVVLSVLALLPCARAADGFPKPVMSGNDVALAECPTGLLPTGLRKQLQANEDNLFTDENGELRKTYEALTLDLNGYGESEYFVADPASYTGGPVIHIFGGEADGYRPLGAVQGEFYTAASVNGYVQLVDIARGGPGSYVRTLYVFEDGVYAPKKQAEYELDDAGGYVFVRDL